MRLHPVERHGARVVQAWPCSVKSIMGRHPGESKRSPYPLISLIENFNTERFLPGHRIRMTQSGCASPQAGRWLITPYLRCFENGSFRAVVRGRDRGGYISSGLGRTLPVAKVKKALPARVRIRSLRLMSARSREVST